MKHSNETSATTVSAQERAAMDAQKLKEEARLRAAEAADAAKTKADDGLSQAGEQIDELGAAIDAAADALSEQDKEGLARYARQLSGGMSQLADNLQHRSIDQLANDARQFARSNPTGFLLGSIALGFGLSRFAKASTDRGQDSEENHRGGPLSSTTAARASASSVNPGNGAPYPTPTSNTPSRTPV